MRAGKSIPGLALVLLLSSWVAACSGGAVQPGDSTETSIVLVRHAERTEFTKVLTKKGRVRAQDLVKAAADMNISAIYSPDLERNLDTAMPLAQHLGITITVTPEKSTPLVNQIVEEMLDKHSGKTILWVGNVSNLRKMYWRLGGDGEGPIEYGDLFIMKISENGPVKIVKTHFGM
jgi:phosphohistidine phosphatase SixA